jgi:UDP-GlcNAc:undecaprenyl-phosphate GlcNAc-1-phosphate transferase
VIAYLIVFLAAASTTFLATPVVRRLVVRWGAVDQPSDRKVHPVAAPTMGGLAMFLGVLVAMGISRFLPFFGDMNHGSPEPLAAVVTCSLMVGLGAIDDKRGTSALAKVTAQIFIGGVLVLVGVQVIYFWLPTGGGIGGQIVNVSSDLAVPLTIVWVVAVCNAVNLVDGLDGLAAGMVGIAAVAFFVYTVRSPGTFGLASSAGLLSAITAGVCLGFLPWNFHPAKIFMGDTGAMLLGMLLSIATISFAARNEVRPSGGDLSVLAIPILTPLLVLFVPFLDVVLAIVRRGRRGQGIGHADKEHLHHRLMDIGHSHRQAVLLMYLWTGLIAVSGLAVGFINGRLVVGFVMIAAVTSFLVTALPRLVDRRRTDPPSSPAGRDDADAQK